MGDEANDAAAGVPPLARMWLDAASGVMEAFQAWAGPTASPEAVRKARATLLDSWSNLWEQYLRTPAFLDSAKQGIARSIDFRKQLREQLDRVQREFRVVGRQDVDELILALERMERHVLDQLDEISARLDALSARLDALGEKAAKPQAAPEAEPARPNNRTRRKSPREGTEEKTEQPAE